jgi:hypothetical protein
MVRRTATTALVSIALIIALVGPIPAEARGGGSGHAGYHSSGGTFPITAVPALATATDESPVAKQRKRSS